MADKRATKRERRDEAKRRRLEELRRRQRQARLRKLAYAAVAGLVIAGIIAAVVFAGGGSDEETNRLAAAAGCEPLQSPPVLPSDHINPPQTATFNSNPPTSGRHYNAAGLGPLTTGIHRAPVQYEGSVHNIEHGHVVIYYKESVGPAIATILAEVVRSDPGWIMLAPNPNMPFQVAFTSWGHLGGCNTPDEQGLKAYADHFVERFRNNAPESIAGQPEPGTDTAVPPTSASPAPTGSPSPATSPASTASPSPSPTST